MSKTIEVQENKDLNKDLSKDLSKIVGPYINTELTTTITIHPRQMDNNIYKNLKDNLIKKVEGRCYSRYGYISKVYKILEYSKGRIIPENPTASVIFGVKFSCKLCHPIKKRSIICKIQKITKMFINASNGPITCIITIDRLNNNTFIFDNKTGKLFAKTGENYKEVLPGTYIKVIIENLTFNDMDKIIMTMGSIQAIPTDEEIKQSFNNEYGSDEESNIDFEKYITETSEISTNMETTLEETTQK
jgi:DNA-directed RNA polymerase subunit E'/Rpb7